MIPCTTVVTSGTLLPSTISTRIQKNWLNAWSWLHFIWICRRLKTISNLPKVKSKAIVALLLRLNMQAFAFSSQLDTITLVNLPVSEPRILEIKLSKPHYCIATEFDDTEIVLQLSESQRRTTMGTVKRSPSKQFTVTQRKANLLHHLIRRFAFQRLCRRRCCFHKQ